MVFSTAVIEYKAEHLTVKVTKGLASERAPGKVVVILKLIVCSNVSFTRLNSWQGLLASLHTISYALFPSCYSV